MPRHAGALRQEGRCWHAQALSRAPAYAATMSALCPVPKADRRKAQCRYSRDVIAVTLGLVVGPHVPPDVGGEEVDQGDARFVQRAVALGVQDAAGALAIREHVRQVDAVATALAPAPLALILPAVRRGTNVADGRAFRA